MGFAALRCALCVAQELVAHTEHQYINIAVDLITNHHFRKSVAEKIVNANMSVLYNRTEARADPQLFKMLIELRGKVGYPAEHFSKEACVAEQTAKAQQLFKPRKATAPPADNERAFAAMAEVVCAEAEAAGRAHAFGMLKNDLGGPLREGEPVVFHPHPEPDLPPLPSSSPKP